MQKTLSGFESGKGFYVISSPTILLKRIDEGQDLNLQSIIILSFP